MHPPPYPPPKEVVNKRNQKFLKKSLRSESNNINNEVRTVLKELVLSVERDSFKNKIIGDLYVKSPPLPTELPYPPLGWLRT